MRLAIACSSIAAGKGGAERISVELANEMVSRGHQVCLVYKDQGNPSYYIKQSISKILWKEFREINNELRGKLINFKPDVFVVFYYNSEVFDYYKAIAGENIPFAIQECVHPERMLEGNWKVESNRREDRYFERGMVASAASAIRVESKEFFSFFPKITKGYIHAAYNPVLPAKKVANVLGSEGHKKYLINIGGLKKHKNIKPLLLAFSILKEFHGEWRIKVCSKDDPSLPYNKEVKNYCSFLGVLDYVDFLGEVDNIYDQYAESHVHVITSLSESFGMCVAESMVHGLPTVGYNVCPGVNELVSDNSTGLLVDYSESNVESLVEGLRKLMESAGLRQRLGAEALVASKKFDYSVLFDEWESILKNASVLGRDKDALFERQAKFDLEEALLFRRIRENATLYK